MKLKKYALGIWHSYKTTQQLRRLNKHELLATWFDAHHLASMQKVFSTGKISIDEEQACRCTALLAATARGNIDIVTWLLSKGANIDHQSSDNGSAFHVAASCGHIDILQLLHNRYSIDIDQLDDQGQTALINTAFLLPSSSLGLVQKVTALLLQWGANPLLQDLQGFTALDHITLQIKDYDDKKSLDTFEIKNYQDLVETKEILEKTIAAYKEKI